MADGSARIASSGDSRPLDIYSKEWDPPTAWKSVWTRGGFYRPSGYIIFVFDPPKFYRHVMNGAAPELMEWATNNYDPPIIVANGYCWILSPGPVPRESDERYP